MEKAERTTLTMFAEFGDQTPGEQHGIIFCTCHPSYEVPDTSINVEL